MVINMTELPIMSWSTEQQLTALKLCKDGILRDWPLPEIHPSDSAIKARDLAWTMAEMLEGLNVEAVIIQGEPVYVASFVNNYCGSQCYSPCYEDGKFVQFRRF